MAPEIWERLTASIDRDLNTLVVGAPGSGKTSILRMLALRENARPAVFVDLARASTAADALLLIANALGLPQPMALTETFGAFTRPARLAPDNELLGLVATVGRADPSLLLLDEPPGGDEGHRLFGRLRDELWQLEHQWVVAASPQSAASLDRPPANAFFESRLVLGALDASRQREMLERRLPEAAGSTLDELVGQVERPRELLALARETLLAGASPGAVRERFDAVQGRLEALSELERQVVDHLRIHGGAYSSDPALLSALSISAPRAAQVLKRLASAGITKARQERHGQGRPRTIYELAPELQP